MKQKDSVVGVLETVAENTELITGEKCGMDADSYINLTYFYIKNDDSKNIYVSINESGKLLLKPGEMYDLPDHIEVYSCKVLTDNATVRFGGIL